MWHLISYLFIYSLFFIFTYLTPQNVGCVFPLFIFPLPSSFPTSSSSHCLFMYVCMVPPPPRIG
jgi:hypothetical protein